LGSIFSEVLFIVFLIVANGILAMSEIAIVSARRARLQHMALTGSSGAQKALELANNPNNFLSTIQIGITLVGVLAGAFGGATIAEQLAPAIATIPSLAHLSETISIAVVVISITYLSLVIGELVPKRLGLQRAERIATFIARPMTALTKLSRPASAILGASTDVILKILGVVKKTTEPDITEDEIRILIHQGTQAGVFHQSEKEIIERVFIFGDRRVSSFMTPRPDIEWLNLDAPAEEIKNVIKKSLHTRFPVGAGRLNQFVGVVSIRDLFIQILNEQSFNISACVKPALFIPETMNALKALEEFKKTRTQYALIVDEYGTITGLVTLEDMLESIVGDVPSEGGQLEPAIVQREDGSWLVDGLIPLYDLRELFRMYKLFDEEAEYNTLAGFVLEKLGRIPSIGDHFKARGLRFEVVDLDGKRIDKVLISKQSSVKRSRSS
jgi:putative hemolysin